jgi:hypothetical protein
MGFDMNKKEQKQKLLAAILAAMYNTPGDYKETDGIIEFTLPNTGTIYRINCNYDPVKWREERLREFAAKINKSPAFINSRSPKV